MFKSILRSAMTILMLGLLFSYVFFSTRAAFSKYFISETFEIFSRIRELLDEKCNHLVVDTIIQ